MGVEWIKAVRIKPDGVYLVTKSNNDSFPYRSKRFGGLSDVHRAEGQPGLDREIVRMLFNYGEIRGSDPSITRYRPCLRDSANLHRSFIQSLDAEYAKLTPEDKATVLRDYEQQTDGARGYNAYERGAQNALYTQAAQLAEPLPPAKKRDTGAR
jgi:hypothetical protein